MYKNSAIKSFTESRARERIIALYAPIDEMAKSLPFHGRGYGFESRWEYQEVANSEYESVTNMAPPTRDHGISSLDVRMGKVGIPIRFLLFMTRTS